MSNLALCRMCLASNTKMHHIADTAYQKIFEKLSTKLNTMSGLPESVCCVCMAHLQRCRQLMEMVRKAEDVLMQFTQSGMQLSEDTVSFLDRKFVRQLSWTNIQTLSIDEESNSPPVKAEIKDELSDDQNCITIEDEVISGFCGTNEILNRIYSSERNAVLWLTHVETNLTHTEMRIENFHDQTFPSEIDEPISDETVSQTVHSEIKNTEIPQNEQGTDHVIVEIKQELMEVPAEFEVEFTNTTEATTSRNFKIPRRSYKATVTGEDGQPRVKHACPHCERTYVHRCHLLRHIKMHVKDTSTNETRRDYCCDVCGKVFVQKCSLKKHFQFHTEKKFACEHCPVKCTQKIDMERHMLMHTGIKPYQCDICKQKFSRKSNLVLHIQTHVAAKPFSCHICQMSFTRKYDLNRHKKRRHICEKPYTCDMCEFRSDNASYMKTHIAKIHLKATGAKKEERRKKIKVQASVKKKKN